MNTDQKLDQILERIEDLKSQEEQIKNILERIENLEKLIIASLPSGKRPQNLVGLIRKQHSPDKVLNSRVDEVLRQFKGAVDCGYAEKKRQGFNSAIIGAAHPAKKYGIVPESILRNRCSLRKLFAPDFDAGETHSSDNATAAIDEAIARGLLQRSTVAEANVTGDPCFSRTAVLVTPKEWERISGEKEPDIEIDLKSEERASIESNAGDSEDEIIDDEGFEEE